MLHISYTVHILNIVTIYESVTINASNVIVFYLLFL